MTSPIIPKLAHSDEPVDSLMILDIKNIPVWDDIQYTVVGLNFVKGNAQHIITKCSDDFSVS